MLIPSQWVLKAPQDPHLHPSFLPSFLFPLRSQDKRQTPVASISWTIAALLMWTLNKLVAFSRCNQKDVVDLMEEDSQRLLAGWTTLLACFHFKEE